MLQGTLLQDTFHVQLRKSVKFEDTGLQLSTKLTDLESLLTAVMKWEYL